MSLAWHLPYNVSPRWVKDYITSQEKMGRVKGGKRGGGHVGETKEPEIFNQVKCFIHRVRGQFSHVLTRFNWTGMVKLAW